MYSHETWEALADWEYCHNLMASRSCSLISGQYKTDIIFVWGRADGEWQPNDDNQSVLEVAARLRYTANAEYIVLPGYVGTEKGQGNHGYPGPVRWQDGLVNIWGIPSDRILVTSGQGCNTKTEMEDCLNLMEENGWKTVIGVTLHSHAMRAMLGAVRSIKQRGDKALDIRIAPAWPDTFDQRDLIYGSQGEGPYPRYKWYEKEFERIPRYMKQGDLASIQELKEYLERFL